MKKILLAGLLLSASTLCILETNAANQPAQMVRLALPKPVSDAFKSIEAQFAADGFIITNVQWTRVQNRYTATFCIADMNSDNIVDGSATWLASGQRVN
jgi:hypothetical protein